MLNPHGDKIATYGNGQRAISPDGSSATTTSLSPGSIAVDHAGNIIYADGTINRVRRINIANGKLETVAGIGPSILGENGPALETVAGTGTEGSGLAIARNGDLLIGDTGTFRLRELLGDGTLKTIGGAGGILGPQNDGVPATEAAIYPVAMTVDSRGEIDVSNRSDIVHIDASGRLFHTSTRDVNRCTLDGEGGPFPNASICQPWDVLRDANDNLLIADTNNNRIRVLTTIPPHRRATRR